MRPYSDTSLLRLWLFSIPTWNDLRTTLIWLSCIQAYCNLLAIPALGGFFFFFLQYQLDGTCFPYQTAATFIIPTWNEFYILCVRNRSVTMGRTPTDSDPFLCVRNTSVTAGRAVTHYDPFLCVQHASVTTGRAEIHCEPFLCVYRTRMLQRRWAVIHHFCMFRTRMLQRRWAVIHHFCVSRTRMLQRRWAVILHFCVSRTRVFDRDGLYLTMIHFSVCPEHEC